MPFTVLPAVDVAGGRAVRLGQGDAGAETTDDDPCEVALPWQAGGAEWIHLVDVDAAFGRGDRIAAGVDVRVVEAAGRPGAAPARRTR